ncbi:MAG: hypothetical protein WBB85_03940, partial [Albidovulum sp.]|uniref:hypothetical protein n=1 Tax=Albidovulum sp. TaxID=1872424 RepID=UPI003C9ABB7A
HPYLGFQCGSGGWRLMHGTLPSASYAMPDPEEVAAYHARSPKPLMCDVLQRAKEDGRTLIQPRCGVGGQSEMIALLRHLDTEGHADLLTLTIDSHTRLTHFDRAAWLLAESPDQLNGYPLVAHGWEAARALNEQFGKPIQIRHGSPDARTLFNVSLCAGFSSFEGGGISYNLPYCKDIPLSSSLRAWQEIDTVCGQLGQMSAPIDREFFGSLSGVLVPPSISLAVIFLEAALAAQAGCTCLSLAIPQNGSVIQDTAALRCIPRLARLYLPDEAQVFPVLHQFMGVFPKEFETAEQMIFLGGLTARLGGATKTITKTTQEAQGIPDASVNAAGLRTTRVAFEPQFGQFTVPEDRLQEEMYWIERETRELLDPIMAERDLIGAIVRAFREGRLDIPFPSNRDAWGATLPVRDQHIAVRFAKFGNLPFSEAVRKRNDACLSRREVGDVSYLDVIDSIFCFADQKIGRTPSHPTSQDLSHDHTRKRFRN